jgi:hypothetical protein
MPVEWVDRATMASSSQLALSSAHDSEPPLGAPSEGPFSRNFFPAGPTFHA